MAARAPVLKMSELCKDHAGITKAMGTMLYEACNVCLDHHRHPTRVSVKARMDTQPVHLFLAWSRPTIAASKANADLQEATERGACAVAIMVARKLLKLATVERARKRTGIDYWLGQDDGLFQRRARLEVSGILQGNEAEVRSRMSQKLAQTAQSDHTQLPVFAVVVEFSAPTMSCTERHGT